MPTPSLRDLLTVATEAAYLAGRRTLAYFNTGVACETKADDTPVTCADREAEQIIRRQIAKYFPDHGILGEEHGQIPGDPDYRWLIDPIDGTKTFIHGVPLYGTLIGVEVHGVSRVGVIYLPALDEMLTAAEGQGCTWNGRPARVSACARLEEATLLVSDPVQMLRRSDAFERLTARARLVRGWGDCYGYALVATGRADIMPDHALKPWDCGAIVPVLREAGGRFTSWHGDESAAAPDGVATNGLLHDTVLAVTLPVRAE
jgi:histidinol phosphatase-like enzyme (inositol monophosphatase family)